MDKINIELGVEGSPTGGKPPVQVGILGLGRSFLQNHMRALSEMRDYFRVVALCDVEKPRRDVAAETFSEAHLYRRINDMMDDTEMELLFISLPRAHPERVALAGLRHGLWTITETPMSFTYDGAAKMRAASAKARNRLSVCVPEMISPDFRLACLAAQDKRLGPIYEIRVRCQRWERRSDWQTLGRCGGGMSQREGLERVMQAVRLMKSTPTQLWGDLKRLASAGDAEDYMRLMLKAHGQVTADIEISGAHLGAPEPSFTLRGEHGVFTVAPGASEGMLRFLDPAYKLPRRRSSVQTPPLATPVDETPMIEEKIALPAAVDSKRDYWRAVFDWVRGTAPFPVTLDELTEATRYVQVAKQSSPFA